MHPTPNLEPTPTERRWLAEAAATLGLALDAAQIERLLRLRALLLVWNAEMNLTAITDPAAILTRHILDSLACLAACAEYAADAPAQVVDVGSGAGFPGLVLAVARPRWQIASLEATAKKVRFQAAAVAALGLANVSVAQGRAEALARDPAWRGRFDIVTARALANLPTLLEWCLPFAIPGGIVLAPKKGDLADELARGAAAAAILAAAPPEAVPLPPALRQIAPDLDDGRVIVRVRALAATPVRFPRPGAAPVKSPLGSGPV